MNRISGIRLIAAFCLIVQAALSLVPSGARVLCIGECRPSADDVQPHLHVSACTDHDHDQPESDLPRPMRSGEPGHGDDCVDLLVPDHPRRVEVAAALPDLTLAAMVDWAPMPRQEAELGIDLLRMRATPRHPPGLAGVRTTRMLI